MKRIAIVLGTRPEAIKLAPLIKQLRDPAMKARVELRVYSTGQHRQMLDSVFEFFGFRPDVDLNIMRSGQSLNTVAASVLSGMDAVLKVEKHDWIIVQGDTTTAAAAAWSAFNARQRVAHVEAGLRTGDPSSPFPEEINRRIISVVATHHFAPTSRARAALLAEGVHADAVTVSGNTVIDALLWGRERLRSGAYQLDLSFAQRFGSGRLVLITGHRRESFGEGFGAICEAIRTLASARTEIQFVYPVHLNPNVQEPVYRLLANLPNVHLLPPLDYPHFIWLLDRAEVVLTDSGGVQEEAPSLGKPVVVMRQTTERPEGIAAGNAILAGTRADRIVSEVCRLLDDSIHYQAMTSANNPYGDGHASDHIVRELLRE